VQQIPLTSFSSKTSSMEIFCLIIVFPYMGYIGMCGPNGYGFSTVLVINRVSISAISVLNRVWFLYPSLELGMLFGRSYFFIIIDETINKSPSKIMFGATVSAATVISRLSNNMVRGFWKRASHPHQIFLGVSPRYQVKIK